MEAFRLSLLKAGRRTLEAITVKVTLHISINVTRAVCGTGYLLPFRYCRGFNTRLFEPDMTYHSNQSNLQQI